MYRLSSVILGFFLLVSAGASVAEIYRWTDEDGNVIFSDQPHPDAEKIPTPKVQTVSPPPVSLPPPPPEEPEKITYLTFGIVSPADDAPVRSNNGDIDIEVLVEPSLHENHSLRLKLDDRVWGEAGTSTTFALKNIDRGTHTVTAEIIDADGAVVNRTKPVTFHLLRVSVITRPAR